VPTEPDKDLYTKLLQLTLSQLVALARSLKLNQAFISKIDPATVANEICTLAEGTYGQGWEDAVRRALVMVCEGRSYFEEKLGHIKDFLVDPPEPVNVSPEHQGTVKELRAALKERKELEKPQLIQVKGTLFPAALLTCGWWEVTKSYGDMQWKNPLQQWLFEGFDLWAPSWEVSWEFENLRGGAKKPFYIAQLTDGDEADSLAVILPPGRAMDLANKFKKNYGVLEAEITGVLGHRKQAREAFPGEVIPGKAADYCIWLKDDEPKHEVAPLNEHPHLYSGYLWKCLVPRRWLEKEEQIGLSHVYIAWEHTNFAADPARKYNLEALAFKEKLIEKQHRKDGGLVLLQKSHWMVPGTPEWRIEDFYKILVQKKLVDVPARSKRKRWW
jgi:hypothetical protein